MNTFQIKHFVRGLICFCELDSVAWHRARSSPVCVCLYANQPAKRATCRWRHAPIPPWLQVNIWKPQTLSFPDLYTCARTLERRIHFFLRVGIGLETLGLVKNRAIHPRSCISPTIQKAATYRRWFTGYSSLAQEATRLWWIDKSATWWTQTPCATDQVLSYS